MQALSCGQVGAGCREVDHCVSLKVQPQSISAKHQLLLKQKQKDQDRCPLALRVWCGNRPKSRQGKGETFSLLPPLLWIYPVQSGFAEGLCGVLLIKHNYCSLLWLKTVSVLGKSSDLGTWDLGCKAWVTSHFRVVVYGFQTQERGLG